ncbi:MAG: ORF6N domain-containing protein [Bacteroidales bacterium]|nr:ORF6N domain-containing protein [Bacteroidales bacterium]
MNSSILKQTRIESLIHEIRGQKVMLDFDLAELYQVETKRLKESVRRNIERFEGDDFMFELTSEEYNSLIISLRSQIATSNERGGRRHMPFAFTEQGVAMLSSVLKSERAIQVNRSIIRAFVIANKNTTATDERSIFLCFCFSSRGSGVFI